MRLWTWHWWRLGYGPHPDVHCFGIPGYRHVFGRIWWRQNADTSTVIANDPPFDPTDTGAITAYQKEHGIHDSDADYGRTYW